MGEVGIAHVGATFISLTAGYYADRWLGTAPSLALVGLGFGIAVGFVNVFQSAKRK
jgi:F0F1-type ATP synthase assembly protein I